MPVWMSSQAKPFQWVRSMGALVELQRVLGDPVLGQPDKGGDVLVVAGGSVGLA